MRCWPSVPLARIVKSIERAETPVTGTSYRQVGVKLWGVGAYEREPIDGGGTRYKTLSRVEANDIIVNKIWARNGSVAVIPTNLAGCYVSGEFPTFTPVPDKLDPRWFHWITKTRFFWDQCDMKSRGTSGKNRIRPERFLEIEIPLPPLPEQRRIVARIEELAAKINEARGLRNTAARETATIFEAFLKSVFDGGAETYHWPMRPLPEVASISRGKFAYRPRNEPRFYGGKYPFIQIGDISSSYRYIRSYSQTLNDDGVTISRLFPAGTVVIAITGATIGVTGILSFDACFPDSIVGIQPKPEETTSEFIYLAVEHAKRVALAEATQTTQPNINLGNLERLRVYVPTLQDQRRIVAESDVLQEHLDAMNNLQGKTAAELNALLPALLDQAFKGEL